MEKAHVFNGGRDGYDADLFLPGACLKYCLAIGMKQRSQDHVCNEANEALCSLQSGVQLLKYSIKSSHFCPPPPPVFLFNRWWCALGVDSGLPFAGLLSPTGLRQHLALLLRIAGRRNSPFPWVPCMVTRGVLRMKQWLAGLPQSQSFHPLSHIGRQLIIHSFYAPLNSLWNSVHLFLFVFPTGSNRDCLWTTHLPLFQVHQHTTIIVLLGLNRVIGPPLVQRWPLPAFTLTGLTTHWRPVQAPYLLSFRQT